MGTVGTAKAISCGTADPPASFCEGSDKDTAARGGGGGIDVLEEDTLSWDAAGVADT